jgi:Domain of unknown function (DUF4326)
MPERIQRKRTKGWKMPPNTVSVTRPGKWGNPFQIGKNRCHGHGIDFRQEPILDAGTAVRFFREMLGRSDRNYPSDTDIQGLRGKNLACFCKLGEPCHADVLLELANRATDSSAQRGEV